MLRRLHSPFIRSSAFVVSVVFAVIGLGACSGASDSVETIVDAPAAADSAVAGAEGPIAVAAASSEAALAARRAEAGDILKSFTVDFTGPESLAGKVTPKSDGAFCSGPATVADGGAFEVGYAATEADAKITSFSLSTQGSYEGPGSYAAELSWTDASGPQTLLATVYVYDDEMSGEFFYEGSPSIAGTWDCRFEG